MGKIKDKGKLTQLLIIMGFIIISLMIYVISGFINNSDTNETTGCEIDETLIKNSCVIGCIEFGNSFDDYENIDADTKSEIKDSIRHIETICQMNCLEGIE